MSQATRNVQVEARPNPLTIDPTETAVIVVDMQNDFVAEGGMFARAGLPISAAQAVVERTARVLTAARAAGMKVVYLQMAFESDLSNLGGPDAPNRVRHLAFGVGQPVETPDGGTGRFLIKDGVTCSVCVESTLRDAFYRDYQCLLLADCTAEPIGSEFGRSNHDASLLVIEKLFGWVSDSASLLRALAQLPAAAAVQ